MLNKTTTAPENRRPWSSYRVGSPEEHLSGSVLLRSNTRVGVPEEPGSVLRSTDPGSSGAGSAILRSGHLPPTLCLAQLLCPRFLTNSIASKRVHIKCLVLS